MSLNIKGPDGRIVACPRSLIVTNLDTAGVPVDAVNVDALKPGWSVATAADVAALAKAQIDAEAALIAAVKAESERAARLAVALDQLAGKAAAPAKVA